MPFIEVSPDTIPDEEGKPSYREVPIDTKSDQELAEPSTISEIGRGAKRTLEGMVGLGETAGYLASGMVGAAAGGVVGLRQLLAGKTAEEASEEIGRVAEGLTYKPQTPWGKEFERGAEFGMEKIGQAGEWVGGKFQDLLSMSQWTRPIAAPVATAASVGTQLALLKPFFPTGFRERPPVGKAEFRPRPEEIRLERGFGEPERLPPGPEGPKLLGPAPTPALPEGTPQVFLTTKTGDVEVFWNPARKQYEAKPAPPIETLPPPEKVPPAPAGEAVKGKELQMPEEITSPLEDLQNKWMENIKVSKEKGWSDYEDVKAWRMAELIKAKLKRGENVEEVLAGVERRLKREYETAKSLKPTTMGQGFKPGTALEPGPKAVPADIYSETRALNDFAEIKKALNVPRQWGDEGSFALPKKVPELSEPAKRALIRIEGKTVNGLAQDILSETPAKQNAAIEAVKKAVEEGKITQKDALEHITNEMVDIPFKKIQAGAPMEATFKKAQEAGELFRKELLGEEAAPGKKTILESEAGFIEFPKEQLERAGKRFLEFWRPFSTLVNKEEILTARGKALGGIARVERTVDRTWERLKGLSDESKEDVFKAMSGQKDMADLSPDNAHVARHLLNVNDIIGEMLTKRGMISPEQFAAHKGEYIRYMYLKHILGDDANIPVRPNGKLDLSYAKHRQDLTWEQRRALGIVENVALAEPLGMAKSLTDIAKYDYLEKLATDPRNVWQPSIIEIPDMPREFTRRGARTLSTQLSRQTGDPYSGIEISPDRWIVWNEDTKTAVGRKMSIGQLTDEVQIYERMAREAPKSPEIQYRLKTLQDALEKAKTETGNVPEDFIQLPTSKFWGPMAGAFVRKPIARDLMGFWGAEKGNIPGLAGAIEKMARLDETATGIFKTSKAALNIPTAARNMVSNFIQLGMSGMSPLDVPLWSARAAEAMIKKTSEYGQAFRNGLFKTNWSVAELNEVMGVFRKMKGDTWGEIIGKVQDLAKYYGRIDDVFKMAKFLYERSQGTSLPKAIQEAQKWGMDYSLADPSIKWARRHAIPFASYSYKIAPLIAESLIKRPWVVGSLVALPYAVYEIAKSLNKDMTDEDWAELKKTIPTEVKERGTWMLIPIKVGDKYRWFDYSYFLPWGNYVAGIQAVVGGNIKGAVSQFGVWGTPFLKVMQTFAGSVGDAPPKDPFSNQPLYNRLDPAPLKAAKTMEYFYNLMAPGMITRYGALGYTFSIGKEDRWGRKIDTPEAVGRWFGVNLKEANPIVTAAALKAQTKALQDEYVKIVLDPNISSERKEKYRLRLLEEINDLIKGRNK